MTKEEFILAIASKKSNLPKKEITSVIDTFFDVVKETLKANGEISIKGFGIFKISNRKARKGRNPQTGAVIEIPAKKVPKLLFSKKFVDEI